MRNFIFKIFFISIFFFIIFIPDTNAQSLECSANPDACYGLTGCYSIGPDGGTCVAPCARYELNTSCSNGPHAYCVECGTPVCYPPYTPPIEVAPVCGGSCDVNANNCPLNCPMCVRSETSPGSNCQSAPTPTPIPPPACNVECISDSYCQNAQDGCKACLPNPSGQGKTCQLPPPTATATPTRIPTPTATPPLTCNSPCSTPASCTGAINGCTFCNPSTDKCETPPACNTDCTADPTICTQASGGCTVCSPTTKKCVAPPSATPTATSTPSPTATRTPTPTATSTPTPTPLPFDENMCKCDGIDYTSLALGQPATITAYGKVEGIEQNYAKIPLMTFRFYQSSAGSTTATQLDSQTINTTIDSQTAEKTRYKAVWQLTLPSNLDTSQTYRIQAKLNCSRKSAAAFSPDANKVVLAANTNPNPSLWDRIFGFFANLFGGGQNNIINVGPTATPTLTSDQQKQLQLKTFTPARGVSTDNCTFIKFNF